MLGVCVKKLVGSQKVRKERRAVRGGKKGRRGEETQIKGGQESGDLRAFTIGEMVLSRGWVSFTYALG